MANLFGKEIRKEELLRRVGNLAQLAYVRPYTMTEGKSAGLKAFHVVNGGGLEFTLLEGKCLDIAEMKFKGVNLNFLTKPGIVSSEYYNPDQQEFPRSFQGGALFTCGLSNVGTACTDSGTYLPPHGRIGHTPAERVAIVADWQDDEYVMEILGEIREAALFSENLVLRRHVSTKLGSRSITIHDVIENQGFHELPIMILYHFNLGYPLLDECSTLLLPTLEVTARDVEAAKGLDSFDSFIAPSDDYEEQVFYHKPASEENGDTFAGLINERLNLGIYIRYNTSQLPELIQWKSMRSGDYALGIEPANCLVEGRVKEKERGTLKKIPPMGKCIFDLEICVLDGAEEINSFKMGHPILARNS